jgi:hypothetical protein
VAESHNLASAGEEPRFPGEGGPRFPGDRSRELDWLDEVAPDGMPLDDTDVRILDESPVITEARVLAGGPYYITADSGEQVPTDFYADIDDDALTQAVETANQDPPEAFTPDGKATIPSEQRELLEQGGPAAQKLLEAIDRGLETTTPELNEAVDERLRRAGFIMKL